MMVHGDGSRPWGSYQREGERARARERERGSVVAMAWWCVGLMKKMVMVIVMEISVKVWGMREDGGGV